MIVLILHQSQKGIRCFSVSPEQISELRRHISGLETALPNSMHRSGKILLPDMRPQILSLIKPLLTSAEQQRSIQHIHAYVQNLQVRSPSSWHD